LSKITQDSIVLLPWIGRTAKFMDLYLFDFFKEHGIDLSKEQFIVLKYLNDSDGLIQNQLAFITNRSKTALTRLIQTMEKKGLVCRKVSRKDMRINHVYMTEFGRQTWERSKPYFDEIVHELQKGISNEDLRIMKKSLQQIQVNINKKTNINQY